MYFEKAHLGLNCIFNVESEENLLISQYRLRKVKQSKMLPEIILR